MPLARPASFCLKEIGWALKLKKPIVTVVETEGRFHPFDIDRWRRNECTRAANDRWTQGWLSRTYEQCPAEIRALVEEEHAAGKMIPYRRRWVGGMGSQILQRSKLTSRATWTYHTHTHMLWPPHTYTTHARDFEANAMIKEILSRSHAVCGRSWGAILPTNKTQVEVVDAKSWSREVHVVVDEADEGARVAMGYLQKSMLAFAREFSF